MKQDLPRFHQTDITPNDDNCMMTCFGNYFNLPPDDLPQIQYLFYCKHPKTFWLDALKLWLSQMGYNLFYTKDHKEAQDKANNDYYFVVGAVTSGKDHMVIYKDGKLYFDPYIGGIPFKRGLKWYLVLQKKKQGKLWDKTCAQIKQEIVDMVFDTKLSQSVHDLYAPPPFNPQHERFKIK